MRLDDLVPYAKNPRDNDKAVDGVAASIEEFGFRGAIVCDREHEGGTPEHPVIVNGHTRVKALRKLGYDEIPDEWIVYTDGLTEDEVRALRLADNRTAEAATWNRTLLQHEVKGIRSLDMSRFGFDFKGKARPYGAERLRTDRRYHLDLVCADDCTPGGMPSMGISDIAAVPERLQGFNYAKSTPTDAKRGVGCHFFIDDYQFERVWADPVGYERSLRGYDAVLTPDFSLYMDMPLPMMRWNVYRSRAVGLIWQRDGLPVVPTLSWAGPESYTFCFDGIPRGSVVAVSTVGVKEDAASTGVWNAGMAEAMRRLEPSRVLLYGGDIGFDFGECEVIEYANGVTERMANGRKRRKQPKLESQSGGGVSSLTDRQLTSEIDKLGKVMEETAHAHVAYLQGRGGSKADSDRYRKAQARYSELQNESMRRLQAKAARNAAANATKPKPTRTFVNGFGDATHRYITTDTYEHAQQRLEKEIMGFLGRR